MSTRWKVIGRGFNGWHATADGTSGSGGTLESYAAVAVDGCLVYDASKADVRQFVGFGRKDSISPNGQNLQMSDMRGFPAHGSSVRRADSVAK